MSDPRAALREMETALRRAAMLEVEGMFPTTAYLFKAGPPDEPRDERGRWSAEGVVGDQSSVNVLRHPDADNWLTRAFGRKLTDQQIARLAMVPNGGTVKVLPGRGNVKLVGEHAGTKLSTGIFVGQHDIHNDTVFMDVGKGSKIQGHGVGSLLTEQQIKTARELGIRQITLEASGSSEGQHNGYYTWPRLGFDSGPFGIGSFLNRDYIKRPIPGAPGQGTVQDLMALPGGREVWKQFGGTMQMSFDTDPNSRNSKILDAYMAERRAGAKVSDQPVESTIRHSLPEFDDEEEAAWDRLVANGTLQRIAAESKSRKAYSSDEARVPAGSSEGGEWTSLGYLEPPDKSMDTAAVKAEEAKASAALDTPNTASSYYKGQIARDLAARLKGNPAWEGYVRSTGKSPSQATSGLVAMWAGTSANTNVNAVAMQRAINDEFGLGAETDHLHFQDNAVLDQAYADVGPAFRAFARAMYQNTQEELAKDNITSMTLYRGLKFRTRNDVIDAGFKPDAQPHEVTISQQPASSWSYRFFTAHSFTAAPALPGALLAATVPADRVLSTMKTGTGCKEEQEVVVLGTMSDRVAAQAWGTPGYRNAPAGALTLIQTKLAQLSVKAGPPDEPRDDAGKWTAEGGAALVPPPAMPGHELAISQFVDGQQVAADKALNSTAHASEYKVRVMKQLSRRLINNPTWRDYVLRNGTPTTPSPQQIAANEDSQIFRLNSEDATNALIHLWAETSADHDPHAIAMQRAIQDEFGLKGATTTHLAMDPQTMTGSGAQSVYERNGPAYQAFARAMYDNTQDELSKQGITGMLLYRGLDFGVGRGDYVARQLGVPLDNQPHQVMVNQQPASSWSYDYQIARGFTGGTGSSGAVLAARVPAERILSTMKTGVGCKGEKEVVVLGGQDQVTAQAWSENARDPRAPHDPVGLIQLDPHVRNPIMGEPYIPDEEGKVWNPFEPRQPAGVPEGGQWTSGEAGGELHAPDPTLTDKALGKEHNRLDKALNNAKVSREDYKQGVVKAISARLANNKDWQTYVTHAFEKGGEWTDRPSDLGYTVEWSPNDPPTAEFSPEQSEKAASDMVARWAQSSGDGSLPALAMQHAIQKEFGLTDAVTAHMDLNDPRFQSIIQVNEPAMRAFARAMYDNTQAELAKDGITSMTIYRGMVFRSPDAVREAGFNPDGQSHTATIAQQPASSWSYDFNVAHTFVGTKQGGVMMAATVPASRILSTMKTGVGCKPEKEVVVLGGKDTVAANAWGTGGLTPAPPTALALIQTKLAQLSVKAGPPDEPRDDAGKWTAEDEGLVLGRAQRILGHSVTAGQLAALTGAPKGSKTKVVPWESGVAIVTEHPNIEDQAVAILKDNGSLHYEQLFLNRAARGKGVGVKMMADAVRAAYGLGIKKVDLDAVGGGPKSKVGNRSQNGYYTWARLGFDGNIDPYTKEANKYRPEAKPAWPEPYRSVERVSDLMKMPGGAKFWKEWGDETHMTIDTDPNSAGRKVMEAYVKARGLDT
jgi:GNAT superfamily N-acetyltransferase